MERWSIQLVSMPSTSYQEENYQRHKHNSCHFTKAQTYEQKATYAQIVVSYRPQEEYPYRVQITVGGDKTHYAGETFTQNNDITTAKCLFSSVISAKFTKFLGLDIKYFYLNINMEEYEYMWLTQCIFPRFH